MINGIKGLVGFRTGWMVASALLLCFSTCPVNYAAISGNDLASWFDSSGDFSCSGFSGDEKIKAKDGVPLSVSNINDWPDTCQHLRLWNNVHPGADQALAKLQYDTLRMYIERCALSDTRSWYVFGQITGAVQLMSADTNRFLPYRDWLISVLYLNTVQPEYFCACMNAISQTFAWGKNAPLGQLAVKNYLRSNHRECWGSGDDDQYAADSAYYVNGGYDVSHLPPLDSLGLGFLLKSGIPSPAANLSGSYLASFTLSPNPFKDETHLRFHLNRMSYITIGIYDVLGHQVWGDGKGRSLEAGDHEITVDGSSLPEGSLYVRISIGFGEVRTVKLVKE